MQGGLYNAVLRALELLGLADAFGQSRVPLYVLNVTYPLVDAEFTRFCAGKRGILLVEEGQPDFIEQAVHAILRKADIPTRVHGKDLLPMAGEYTGGVVVKAVARFVELYAPQLLAGAPLPAAARPAAAPAMLEGNPRAFAIKAAADEVHPRPPSFCTGCPERPIFTAIKLLERELGPHHVSCDIGCHLFSILPPFNIGATTMGYGLGWAGASAFNTQETGKRTLSIMGDGGFWHNGLTSGVGNAVFNKSDNVLVVIDNGYSAATGGQDLMSSKAANSLRSTNNPIERAVRGVGVKWVRSVNNTYSLSQMRDTLREALTSKEKGPKVVVASSECMLNRQRRVKPLVRQAIQDGRRVVRERFGIDPDTCTGDHSCIRLSGCPSLTIKPNPDPLRRDPIASVIDSCVGCGLCGEVADAAVAVPLVLPRRDHQQPESLGSLQAAGAHGGDRLAAEAHRAAAGRDCRMTARATTIAILAMGGEGGGVLADWLVDLAEQNGFAAQATSVPGVAQRTGATIYYVEIFPLDQVPDGAQPVLGLSPVPGEVDIVIASELMEAGRALQRGLVTPGRTAFIASTHRVYSMSERTAMGDGRVDAQKILDGAHAAARQFVSADFGALAERAGSLISPVLYGALAACGALPFTRQQYEETIRRGGVGVGASLKAFSAGFELALGRATESARDDASAVIPDSIRDPSQPWIAVQARNDSHRALPAVGPRLAALAQRIAAQFPAAVHATLRIGIVRLADYQDVSYAGEYLDRLVPLLGCGPELLDETARCLALWMSYEDTIRVADLKTRRTRFERVAGEVKLAPGQQLDINEFMHPRVEEIADTLPAGDGALAVGNGLGARLHHAFHAQGSRRQDQLVARLPAAVPGRFPARHAAQDIAIPDRAFAHRPVAGRDRAACGQPSGAGAGSGALAAPGQGLRRYPCAGLEQLPAPDGRAAAVAGGAARREQIARPEPGRAGRRQRSGTGEAVGVCLN